MNNIGWISLHRKILDSWVWEDKPFSYGQAWTDMILTANYEDNNILFEGKIITIPRGAFHTSILKLADRYGWNRKKTTKFLDLLETQKMVTTERTTHGTTVTIVNYDKFQVLGATIGTAKDATQGTTKEQPRDTNNNINNYNKIINNNMSAEPDKSGPKNIIKKFISPSVEEVQQYCKERNNVVNAQSFIDFYESKGWMIGKNRMKDWKAAVRTWERYNKAAEGVKETVGNNTYDSDEQWDNIRRTLAETKRNSEQRKDIFA